MLGSICTFVCQYCKGKCRKSGRQRNGAQKLYCRVCKKYQQSFYVKQAYRAETDDWISKLVSEGVGVRGISRLLNISVSTVISRVVRIGRKITKPAISQDQRSFEVDELWTYIGKKSNEFWVAYAYNKEADRVEDFVVGRRTKSTLRPLINRILSSGVKQLRTDGLPHYKRLIPKKQHRTGPYCTNHIERKNLSIRTHLKRLGRKTICFSRSVVMLESCLRIYFWSR